MDALPLCRYCMLVRASCSENCWAKWHQGVTQCCVHLESTDPKIQHQMLSRLTIKRVQAARRAVLGLRRGLWSAEMKVATPQIPAPWAGFK